MKTTVIGIDLNPKVADQAVVYDRPEHCVMRKKVATEFTALSQLLNQVRETTPADNELVVVLEATGMAWLPVSVFFAEQEIPVYRVKGEQTHGLRQFLSKHVKTDRIDAAALCKLYYLIPEQLYELDMCKRTQFTLKRWISRREDYKSCKTGELNRLQELFRWALPTLSGEAKKLSTKKMQVVGARLLDYQSLKRLGKKRFYEWAKRRNAGLDRTYTDRLFEAAMASRTLYAGRTYVDPAALREEAQDIIAHIAAVEQQMKTIERTIQQLSEQFLPDVPLQTVSGVGSTVETVIKAYLGDGSQFAAAEKAECWLGNIPLVNDSGERQNGKGAKMRKDGPSIPKAYFYIAIETARQRDPQIAAHYYKGMVKKGYTHTQAMCSSVNKLLGRVLRVLKTGAPYELRDCDGNPVSKQEARAIIKERYTVPEDIRTQRKRLAA